MDTNTFVLLVFIFFVYVFISRELVYRKNTKNLLFQIKKLEKKVAQQEKELDTDQMTGLLNRRGFAKHDRRKKERRKYSNGVKGLILYVDIDNFKFVNDTYGHEVGDQLIVWFGNFLKRQISRPEDICRQNTAGDEFIMFFEGATKKQGEKIVQKIERNLSKLRFFTGKDYLEITASIGFAEENKNTPQNKAIRLAEIEMYKKKKTKKQKYARPSN